MKGQVKIQLIDKDGNIKKEINKENLITDAVNEIINPSFYPYFNCYNKQNTNPIYTYSNIAENLFGGLFLFNSDRVENKTHIMPTKEDLNSYVGSAGDLFTGQTDRVKGSLNINETTKLNNGYKFVWDFGTGKSFNIKSLSLTSRQAGNSGLNFDFTNDKTQYAQVFGSYDKAINGKEDIKVASLDDTNYTNLLGVNGKIVYISNDFKTMITANYNKTNNVIQLSKYNFIDKVRLNDNFSSNINLHIENCTNWELEQVYSLVIGSNNNKFDDTYNVYYEDNYIYSVYTEFNNSTKLLTVNFIKIDVDTMIIITQKTFTLNQALSGYSKTNMSYVIINNMIYLMNSQYNMLIVIDINLETIRDVININKLDNSDLFIIRLNDDNVGLFKRYVANSSSLYFILLNTTTKAYSYCKMAGYKSNTSAIAMSNSKRIGNSPLFITKSYNSSGQYLNVNMFYGFFSSILNLDEMITKEETDTLKIIYTITNN